MFRRGFLHIGFEKTGSTSIQAFLTNNVERLRELGYFVPRSLTRNDGFCNHTRLTAYAIADQKLDDDLRLHHGVHTAAQIAPFREETARLLGEEAAQAGDCRCILLSNEHLSSRITTQAELARLRALLASVCDEVKVLVYLRSQPELLQSAYNEAIKTGFSKSGMIPDFSTGRNQGWVVRRYFEYGKTLDLWAEAFGQDNIVVRLFEPENLLFGDVVQDFLFRVHIDPSRFASFPRVNEGLDAGAQRFLQQLNAALLRLPPGEATRIRERAVGILMATRRGKGRRLTDTEAEAFLAQFEAENESVRRRWFPEREALFARPEPRPPAPDAAEPADDAFEIMTLLLRGAS